jgi:hypothetical protein
MKRANAGSGCGGDTGGGASTWDTIVTVTTVIGGADATAVPWATAHREQSAWEPVWSA